MIVALTYAHGTYGPKITRRTKAFWRTLRKHLSCFCREHRKSIPVHLDRYIPKQRATSIQERQSLLHRSLLCAWWHHEAVTHRIAWTMGRQPAGYWLRGTWLSLRPVRLNGRLRSSRVYVWQRMLDWAFFVVVDDGHLSKAHNKFKRTCLNVGCFLAHRQWIANSFRRGRYLSWKRHSELLWIHPKHCTDAMKTWLCS